MKFHEEKKKKWHQRGGKIRGNHTADNLHINMVPTRSGQRSLKFKSTNTKNRTAGEGLIIWAFH